MNPTPEEPVQTEPTNEPTNEPTIEESEPPINIKDIPKNILENVENTETKQKLIFTIQKYQDSSRFGKIVKYELGFKDTFTELSEKPENELENMLHRIRTHLDNKNLDKFYENMATTAAITYEQAMSLVYPIDGFSDLLLDNEDFWNSFERFRIESELPYVNHTTQMLFMIAQFTIIAHHTRNSEPTEPYEMKGPESLETIMEEIEQPTNELVITDTDTTKQNTENEIEIPKPINLGATI